MDNWNIDTPEQVHLSFELAGIGSRFLALALDMLFQSAAVALLLALLYGLEAYAGSAASSWLGAFALIAVVVIFFIYFILFEGVTHGKTPGKMICRLRVIRDDGRPLDWNGTLARNLLRLIDFLPLLYGVGVIVMFLNRQSRRVGDIVAGTLVAREPRIKRPAAGRARPYAPAAAVDAPETPSGRVSRYPLREEELALVRELMTRGAALDRGAYLALCWQVSQPLFEKFMIPQENRQNCEGFLRVIWEENR